MGLIQNFIDSLSSKPEPKQKADLNQAIKPIFSDVPPEPKSSEYLDTLESWAFIAISAIADEISTMDFLVKRETAEGIEDVNNHPAEQLLKNPNSIQSGSMLMWLIFVYWLSEGEAPLLLDKPVNPTQMILLRPDKLEVLSEDGDITGYRYQKGNMEFTDYKAEEVVFLRFPNTKTIFRGGSLLKYIARTVDLDTFNEKHMNAFFYNNATPGFVLQTDKELNKPILQRLRMQFEKRHRGVEQAWRMAVLEKGLKAQKLGSTLQEAMSDKIEAKIRDKILANYKVPKATLGIVEDTNRANTEASDVIFAKRAILPKLNMMIDQLNKLLLPKFTGTENMNYWVDNPVMEDRKHDAEIDQIYLNTGVLEPNEIRERMGLEPLEEPEEPEELNPNEEDEDELEETEKILKEVLLDGEIRNFNITDKDMVKFHNDKIFVTNQKEQELQHVLKKYFLNLKGRLNSSVTKKSLISGEALEVNYSNADEEAILEKATKKTLNEVFASQAALTYALLGISATINLSDEKAKKELDSRRKKFSESVAKTTKKTVARLVEETDDSTTKIELERNIEKKFNELSETKSQEITRTEISAVAGIATVMVYQRTKIIGKEWFTAEDERVCQFCRPMNGKIIPLNRNFWNKGSDMVGEDLGKIDFKLSGIKAPPLHPRCRCDLRPVFAKDSIPLNPFNYQDQSERRGIRRDRKLQDKKELEIREAKLAIDKKEVDKEKKKAETFQKELLKQEEFLDKKEQRVTKEIKQFKQIVDESGITKTKKQTGGKEKGRKTTKNTKRAKR